ICLPAPRLWNQEKFSVLTLDYAGVELSTFGADFEFPGESKASQEIGVGGFCSPSNSRMIATKCSGTGAQAASANSARSPTPNVSSNFIRWSEVSGRWRMSCREYD